MARNAAPPILTAEPGLTHYLDLEAIRRFPMLERQEEYLLAKRWREHGDRDAAHKLVTSHLRLVTKIARDYRGYGLPISDAISEGNVGLMQAVERFEPEKGFRFATYAVWWIKAAIQEYILRSWSLVKMGTTANQTKVFFNLRKAQSKIFILDDGDMRLDQVKIIARRIGVTATDVIYMNRRLGGDASLNAAIRDSGEWQDRLVDESPDQETTLATSEEFDNRRKTLSSALTVLNKRERRIFETRRLADARTKAMPFQGGTTKVARPALVTGRSEYTPAASSSPLRALWLQPTSRIASRIRTSRERADSQFGMASSVRKGGRATTERPMPQIKPMSAKRALRRRWPDVLLRLPLENLRMYGERKE
jgi:RNA polymerase sigma-32 factor